MKRAEYTLSSSSWFQKALHSEDSSFPWLPSFTPFIASSHSLLVFFPFHDHDHWRRWWWRQWQHQILASLLWQQNWQEKKAREGSKIAQNSRSKKTQVRTKLFPLLLWFKGFPFTRGMSLLFIDFEFNLFFLWNFSCSYRVLFGNDEDQASKRREFVLLDHLANHISWLSKIQRQITITTRWSTQRKGVLTDKFVEESLHGYLPENVSRIKSSSSSSRSSLKRSFRRIVLEERKAVKSKKCSSSNNRRDSEWNPCRESDYMLFFLQPSSSLQVFLSHRKVFSFEKVFAGAK